jgi:hypothetical protein
MECENCKTDHTGEYGSGRFCSSKCARGFSTKNKRDDINKRVSFKLKGTVPIFRTTKESAAKAKQTCLNKLMHSDFDSLGYDTKRKRIILEQEQKCNHCGISEWRGSPISLEIDHINGIRNDDRRINLEALCPNCHSLTDTWRGRNKPCKNGNNKVSDEDLSLALKNNSNIRQALLSVGLAAKGNNYERAKKLLT